MANGDKFPLRRLRATREPLIDCRKDVNVCMGQLQGNSDVLVDKELNDHLDESEWKAAIATAIAQCE